MSILITLGHGRSKNGSWDSGAIGNGTNEADWLRGDFLRSLKYHAGNRIDFYEQNLFGNREAATIKKYDDVIELHLDAAGSTAKGGHVIIYKSYKPDAMDNRLGVVIQKHFGLRGGKMFDHRDNLHNLNTFAKRGISYRLLELGFITNKENMDHFKKNYDTIAKDLVQAILNVTIPPQKKEEVKPVKPKTYRKVLPTHEEAWNWAEKEGYLNGEQPGEFMTREQFATVLQRIYGEKKKKK